jgi:hypothetical protein
LRTGRQSIKLEDVAFHTYGNAIYRNHRKLF